MLLDELDYIVRKQKDNKNSALFIKNLLKEHLQLYVLTFIYTHKVYKEKFIFTGGTCLRHFYNLPRLSEDLDFDLAEKIDIEILKDESLKFFESKYLYKDLKVSVRQSGKQLLLKFPILHKLDLANLSESDLLYIKLDLEITNIEETGIILSTKTHNGLNFVAKHYDLETLMANKIFAILVRKRFVGKKNRRTIKGRDYFDLLWFIKNEVRPNLRRLKFLLQDDNLTIKDVENMLDKSIDNLQKYYLSDIKADLIPFISDTSFLDIYVKNYYDEYMREKYKSFG